MIEEEEFAGGSAPAGVGGVEVGPIGGRAMSEVVKPKGENSLLLLLLLQGFNGVFEYFLEFTSFVHAQYRNISPVATSTQQWQPCH